MACQERLQIQEALLHFEAVETGLCRILSRTRGGLGEYRPLVAQAVRAAENAEHAVLADLDRDAAAALRTLAGSRRVIEHILGLLQPAAIEAAE